MDIFTVTEDPLSTSLAVKLVGEHAELKLASPMELGGVGNLKKKMPQLISLSMNYPVLVVVDLDNIACPVARKADWLNGTEPSNLLFRIAVRESESWLLADREALSEFTMIPLIKIAQSPDELPDPKQFLLNLVQRHASKACKYQLLPEKGSKAKVGVGYNAVLKDFVDNHWCPERAALHSPSLAKARRRLAELVHAH